MTTFKRWLYERFLPAWCREELLGENRRLRERAEAQRQEIDRLNAYIGGLHAALRRQSRITIYGREARRE